MEGKGRKGKAGGSRGGGGALVALFSHASHVSYISDPTLRLPAFSLTVLDCSKRRSVVFFEFKRVQFLHSHVFKCYVR